MPFATSSGYMRGSFGPSLALAEHGARRDRLAIAAASTGPDYFTLKARAVAAASQALRVAQARPLSIDGVYDRSAIMRLAIANARLTRANGTTASWSMLMSAALRHAWFKARSGRVVS